jgi:two-component system chemotaxis response regulator CheB
MPDVAGQLVRAIRAAAAARLKKTSGGGPAAILPHLQIPVFETSQKVLAIGASTGGTKAIEAVMTQLPATTPGTVIVQHMPEHFTAAFAERLNRICAMEIREARDADSVVPGVALIAPGNKHLTIHRSEATYRVRIKDGPPVHYQRPSVDVMFLSAARNVGKHATGVILTGMGADGAKGLLSMRESGARTIAQDQESCVVFGMPKEAINLGAAEQVLPLLQIPQAILQTFAVPMAARGN